VVDLSDAVLALADLFIPITVFGVESHLCRIWRLARVAESGMQWRG
jgi:hypothetical protein